MNGVQLESARRSAEEAAREAGGIMREHLHAKKRRKFEDRHDIKLELDDLCQKRIESRLRIHHPEIPVLGEEGETGLVRGRVRWVVDPIDGTVNFAYGIPHACVSIALQERRMDEEGTLDGYRTIAGVIFDPFLEEMWSAIHTGPATLNGRELQVSRRDTLETAIVAFGFSKTRNAVEVMLPRFNQLVRRVRKMRILGSAALSLAWVAEGRLDAFVESSVHLWDIAAGGLVLERAGGEFHCRQVGDNRFSMIASNGLLRGRIEQFIA